MAQSTPTWLIGPSIPPAARLSTVLSGTYRLDAFLGQGMTGITYNAWHLRQKAPYAVKLLHRELAPSHERVIRLRQDLRGLGGLGRLGFLPVELSFAPDGAPFLAAELLSGETLRQRLGRGPMPVLAAGMLVAALCRALGPAHQLGVVHGDLRPENVFIPLQPGQQIAAGQPVLLDAALHHLRQRPIGLDETLPLSKLAYLAPEQAGGEVTSANAEGDIFALGAILYECLTGKQAFGGGEMEAVLERLSRPPAALELARESGAPPGLSVGLDVVVAGACARDPEARVPTMAVFLDGLMQAFEGAGLPLPPPGEGIPTPADHRLGTGRMATARRSTVAVKKVLPVRRAGSPAQGAAAEDLPDLPDLQTRPAAVPATSGGHAALAVATAVPGGARPTAPARVVSGQAPATMPAVARPAPRPTVTLKARDPSRPAPEAQAEAGAAEEPGTAEAGQREISELERQLEAGKAAVLARAEAARLKRQGEDDERGQREAALQQAAREAKGRVLEAARAEVLGRMRAEMDEKAAQERASRAAQIAAAAELQALEAERQEAERKEAEQAERAKKEGERAERARREAEQAEMARQEAERQEAERRESERMEGERAEAAQLTAQEAERQRAEAARQRREAEDALAEAQRAVADVLAGAPRVTGQMRAVLAQDAAAKGGPAGAGGALAPLDEDEAGLWETAAQEAVVTGVTERVQAATLVAARARAREEERALAAAAAREAARQAEISRVREAAQLRTVESRAQAARAKGEARLLAVVQAEKAVKEAEEARARAVSKVRRVTQTLSVVRLTLGEEIHLEGSGLEGEEAGAQGPGAAGPGAASGTQSAQSAASPSASALSPASPSASALSPAPADASPSGIRTRRAAPPAPPPTRSAQLLRVVTPPAGASVPGAVPAAVAAQASGPRSVPAAVASPASGPRPVPAAVPPLASGPRAVPAAVAAATSGPRSVPMAVPPLASGPRAVPPAEPGPDPAQVPQGPPVPAEPDAFDEVMASQVSPVPKAAPDPSAAPVSADYDDQDDPSLLEVALSVSGPQGTLQQPRRAAEPVSLPGLEQMLEVAPHLRHSAQQSMLMPAVPAPAREVAKWLLWGALILLAATALVLVGVLLPHAGTTPVGDRSPPDTRQAALPPAAPAKPPASAVKQPDSPVKPPAAGLASPDLAQRTQPAPDLAQAADLAQQAPPADLAAAAPSRADPVPPAARVAPAGGLHRRNPPDPRIPPLRTAADRPIFEPPHPAPPRPAAPRPATPSGAQPAAGEQPAQPTPPAEQAPTLPAEQGEELRNPFH